MGTSSTFKSEPISPIDALFAADAKDEEFINSGNNPSASLEDVAFRMLYEEATRKKNSVDRETQAQHGPQWLGKLIDIYCRRSKIQIDNALNLYRKLDKTSKSLTMGKAIRVNLKAIRLSGAKDAKIYARELGLDTAGINNLIAIISVAVGETTQDQ